MPDHEPSKKFKQTEQKPLGSGKRPKTRQTAVELRRAMLRDEPQLDGQPPIPSQRVR